MPDHSFSKDIFPNIQSKLPLMPLEAMLYILQVIPKSAEKEWNSICEYFPWLEEVVQAYKSLR